MVLALLAIGIPALILVAPAVVYGGFAVPVNTVSFGVTTGSLTVATPQSAVTTVTVYQYLAMKAGGMVKTSDGSLSNTQVASITIHLTLTTPSGQTVTLSNINLSGGIGTRTHTLTLGPDEGVRGTGSFTLNITVDAQISTPSGVLVGTFSQSINTTFIVA